MSTIDTATSTTALQRLLASSTFFGSAKPAELAGTSVYKNPYTGASASITAALQTGLEWAASLGFNLGFTSITGGTHEGGATDPHYTGNAADIGVINGSSAPGPIWANFIRQNILGNPALQNGGAIGTAKSLVDNPNLQAIAQEHGVNLFEDDVATGASGDHIHFQAAGGSGTISMQPSILQQLLAKNPGLSAALQNAGLGNILGTIENPAGAATNALLGPFKLSGLMIGAAVLGGLLLFAAIIWTAAGSGSAVEMAGSAQKSAGKTAKGVLNAAQLALMAAK